MTRPSDLRIPVGYPNDDPTNGPGMGQGDYDDGAIGGDSLRTVPELLAMPTFNRLAYEFQRAYLAMVAAAWVEAGLLLGVGTGWRDYDTQKQRWLENPFQFANPDFSLHVNKGWLGVEDVAYAIDTVPYDALGWAHANCGRFGINYLDHIAHERHHCQPAVLPNGGSQFNLDPVGWTAKVAVRVNLPYLVLADIDDWYVANAELKPAPDPTPLPPPTIEEFDMALAAIAKTKDAATLAQFAHGGRVLTVGETPQHDITQAEVFGRGGGKAYDIVNRKVVSWSTDSPGSWEAVKATLTAAEVRALMGV